MPMLSLIFFEKKIEENIYNSAKIRYHYKMGFNYYIIILIEN
jgi:hypothetical protein